jgi:GT2 family glycosyltransferase
VNVAKKVSKMYRTSDLARTECLRSVPIGKFYFLYCEDTDFTFKLLSSGSSAVVISDAILYHIHQASIRRNFTEFRAAYYLWRNNLWIPIIFYDPLDLVTAIIPALAFRLLFCCEKTEADCCCNLRLAARATRETSILVETA